MPNSATNLMSRDPEFVLLREERIALKHNEGCAACQFRNKKAVFGDRYVCNDLSRQPITGLKFCHEWKLDEGL